MSKVIAAIQGVPMRKVVSRRRVGGHWVETLACGHTKDAEKFELSVTCRRCYVCKFERLRKEGKQP